MMVSTYIAPSAPCMVNLPGPMARAITVACIQRLAPLFGPKLTLLLPPPPASSVVGFCRRGVATYI